MSNAIIINKKKQKKEKYGGTNTRHTRHSDKNHSNINDEIYNEIK